MGDEVVFSVPVEFQITVEHNGSSPKTSEELVEARRQRLLKELRALEAVEDIEVHKTKHVSGIPVYD